MTVEASSGSLPGFVGEKRAGGALFLSGCALLFLIGCVLHTLAGCSEASSRSGHAWGSDDAYISYRYALNLRSGHGLVFNPGERVEGYSNLLYTLLMAGLLYVARPEHLYTLSVGVNFLCALAALALFGEFAREEAGERCARAVVLLLALCPSLWLWVASGLETPLMLLLQVSVWAAVERHVRRGDPNSLRALCAAGALASLVRADGFLFPGIALAYLLIKGRTRAGGWLGLALAATVGLNVAWRLGYYGYPLPNTFYVKVSGGLAARGVAAVRQFARLSLNQPALLVCLGAAVLLGGQSVARAAARTGGLAAGRAALRFDLLFCVLWFAYWVFIGGDHFGERFLVLLYPAGILALARRAGTRNRRPPALFVGGFALLLLATLVTDPRFRYETGPKYDSRIALGRFLGARHPGTTIAIDAAGKVPYFSGLKTIDMLGLNDAHIAHTVGNKKPSAGEQFAPGHTKFDPLYILGRRPELIATWVGAGQEMFWGLDRPLYTRSGYRLAYVVNATPHAMRENVVPVAGRDDAAIARLVNAGYYYGVLSRAADVPAAPAARSTP